MAKQSKASQRAVAIMGWIVSALIAALIINLPPFHP